MKFFREGKYLGFKKLCPNCLNENKVMFEVSSSEDVKKWFQEFNNKMSCSMCGQEMEIENHA